MRYVVNAADPFIVGQGGPIYSGKPVSTKQPFGTLTTENHRSVVVPSIVPIAHYNGRNTAHDADAPLSTITAHPKGGSHALAAAYLSPYYSDKRPNDARGQIPDEPINTVTTENRHAIVSAVLTGVGGRAGQSRPRGVDEPTATVTSKADAAVVSAFLSRYYNNTTSIAADVRQPAPTVTAWDHNALVTAHIQRDMGQSVGHAADVPLGTVTAGGGGKSAIVTRNLIKLRGTSNAAATDEPLATISAGGQHHAEVRAFLLKYYGTDQDPRLEEPLHTVTTKDRYGLVTIAGQDYQIVDIGLRMLAPRELFRAQGFGDDYIIDMVPDWEKLFVDGQQVSDINSIEWRPLTKSAQVRMCGNSVCPPMARALIQANFKHEREIERAA